MSVSVKYYTAMWVVRIIVCFVFYFVLSGFDLFFVLHCVVVLFCFVFLNSLCVLCVCIFIYLFFF